MSEERRLSLRKPVEGEDAFGLLVIDRAQIPVLIINESIHGLGLVAISRKQLQPGMEVTFQSKFRRVESRIANLKHVAVWDAHICRIGLQWVD